MKEILHMKFRQVFCPCAHVNSFFKQVFYFYFEQPTSYIHVYSSIRYKRFETGTIILINNSAMTTAAN